MNLLIHYNLNVVNLNEIKLGKKILDKSFSVDFQVLTKIEDVFLLEIQEKGTD